MNIGPGVTSTDFLSLLSDAYNMEHIAGSLPCLVFSSDRCSRIVPIFFIVPVALWVYVKSRAVSVAISNRTGPSLT